jgi:hypothetical protein
MMGPDRQRGQAIVETLVVAGIAVLLMLGIWYLGKFHDMQAATITAARYTAWERTAQDTGQLSNARLQEQVRMRLYTWNANAFRDDDGRNVNANSAAAGLPANWTAHDGSTRLIARPADIQVSTADSGMPGRAQAAIDSAFGMLTGVLSAATGGERLPPGGMTRGTVRVQLANVAALPAPLNQLNLSLTETSAVVSEAWDASGPRQAAERSRTYVAAGIFGNADALLGPVRFSLSLLEPSFSDFDPGGICPDIVPDDRLSSRTQRERYRGAQPCY